MHLDQSNVKIIKNYVMMPDKPQFSATDVAAATGVNINTVRNTLAIMAASCEIIKTSRIHGRIYYRVIDDTDKLLADTKIKSIVEIATEKGVSRQRIYQKLSDCDIPFLRSFKLTRGEYSVLHTLSEKAEGMMSYDLHAVISLAKLIKLELINRIRLQRHFHYSITAKGREVLNAKS